MIETLAGVFEVLIVVVDDDDEEDVGGFASFAVIPNEVVGPLPIYDMTDCVSVNVPVTVNLSPALTNLDLPIQIEMQTTWYLKR